MLTPHRRVRELNENNTKKFIEERKRRAMLQSRQVENLKKQHGEQIVQLQKDMERVGDVTTSRSCSFRKTWSG